MEIDILFKIAGIGLVAWIINMILKKAGKEEIANFVSIASMIIVLLVVIDMIGGLFESIKSILRLY